MIGRTNDKSPITGPPKIANRNITSNEQMANEFSKFFTNVEMKDASKMAQTTFLHH